MLFNKWNLFSLQYIRISESYLPTIIIDYYFVSIEINLANFALKLITQK